MDAPGSEAEIDAVFDALAASLDGIEAQLCSNLDPGLAELLDSSVFAALENSLKGVSRPSLPRKPAPPRATLRPAPRTVLPHAVVRRKAPAAASDARLAALIATARLDRERSARAVALWQRVKDLERQRDRATARLVAQKTAASVARSKADRAAAVSAAVAAWELSDNTQRRELQQASKAAAAAAADRARADALTRVERDAAAVAAWRRDKAAARAAAAAHISSDQAIAASDAAAHASLVNASVADWAARKRVLEQSRREKWQRGDSAQLRIVLQLNRPQSGAVLRIPVPFGPLGCPDKGSRPAWRGPLDDDGVV